MNAITKNQHITVNDNGKTFEGVAIRADEVHSVYMGQFIVLRLDVPEGNIKTRCFTVNGSARPFNREGAKAL